MATYQCSKDKKRNRLVVRTDSEKIHDHTIDYFMRDSFGYIKNIKLLMYLIFSFILSQDVSSLHLLLENVRHLPTLTISLNDIYELESVVIN